MNRFIIILISLFLFSTPAFSVDVIDACPDRFKKYDESNKLPPGETEQWKALSQNEKNYCACLLWKKPKYWSSIKNFCDDKWLSSDKKNKTTSQITIVVLIVVSVFILFVFRKPIGKIINRKTSN